MFHERKGIYIFLINIWRLMMLREHFHSHLLLVYYGSVCCAKPTLTWGEKDPVIFMWAIQHYYSFLHFLWLKVFERTTKAFLNIRHKTRIIFLATMPIHLQFLHFSMTCSVLRNDYQNNLNKLEGNHSFQSSSTFSLYLPMSWTFIRSIETPSQ